MYVYGSHSDWIKSAQQRESNFSLSLKGKCWCQMWTAFLRKIDWISPRPNKSEHTELLLVEIHTQLFFSKMWEFVNILKGDLIFYQSNFSTKTLMAFKRLIQNWLAVDPAAGAPMMHLVDNRHDVTNFNFFWFNSEVTKMARGSESNHEM